MATSPVASLRGARGRRRACTATGHPWLWYLTQTSDNKIFQQLSVPEIIREVLADLDLRGLVFDGQDLAGAVLHDCDLTGASMVGCRLALQLFQRLPQAA